jgi:LysM repeat protein
VQRGDTLSGIAARYKVGLERLVCYNGIRNANLLSIGQELLIPPKGFDCPSRGGRRSPAPSPSEESGQR